MTSGFWSSVDLTGNQTGLEAHHANCMFWSSVDLTGNQTVQKKYGVLHLFWSSVDLTGNQTKKVRGWDSNRFGAVSI